MTADHLSLAGRRARLHVAHLALPLTLASAFAGCSGQRTEELASGAQHACAADDAGAPSAEAGSASVVLYANGFETPNVAPVVNCGNGLDTRPVNDLFGSASFSFAQRHTVETVVVQDAEGLYRDPSGRAGRYTLGLLSTSNDDLLALRFATDRPYLNVGLDLSALEVRGCGGPFGVMTPALKVSLYDSPPGPYDIAAPGRLLDEALIEGVSPSDPWTFSWQYGTASLDASARSSPHVSLVFDLVQSGYAALDNLSIVASQSAGVVDRDTDFIPDDQECR